ARRRRRVERRADDVGRPLHLQVDDDEVDGVLGVAAVDARHLAGHGVARAVDLGDQHGELGVEAAGDARGYALAGPHLEAGGGPDGGAERGHEGAQDRRVDVAAGAEGRHRDLRLDGGDEQGRHRQRRAQQPGVAILRRRAHRGQYIYTPAGPLTASQGGAGILLERMRYLVLSDVHANLPALDAVLLHAKQRGYDEVMF